MPQRPSDVIEDPDLTGAARRTLQKGGALIGGTARTTYMRESGPTERGNEQTGPGSLRIQSTRLERSLADKPFDRNAPEGVFDLSPTQSGVKLTYGSEVPYAAVHEYGFEGTVQVESHTRTMTQGFGPASAYPQDVTVRPHPRRMDLPERPYLRPALDDTHDQMAEIAEEEVLNALFDED